MVKVMSMKIIKTRKNDMARRTSQNRGKKTEINEKAVNDIIEERNASSFSEYECLGNNCFSPTSKTVKKLDSGLYYIKQTNSGRVFFQKNELNTDELVEIEDSISNQVVNEVEKFWRIKDKFKTYGFLHRRGYLLYGPQGSGKTMLVNQIVSKLVKEGGIAVMCDTHPINILSGLQYFRMVEPDRNIICIFEDIDSIIDIYGESAILSILDGESKIDNVLNIATTNYPEKLEKRVIARPRRFDRIIKVDFPGDNIRRVYLKDKLKIQDTEIDEWIKKTKGFSFASLADLVISVKCFDGSLDDTVKILKDLQGKKKSSNEFAEHQMGFGGDRD